MNAADRGIHRAISRDRRRRKRMPVDGANVRNNERIRIKRDKKHYPPRHLKRGASDFPTELPNETQ